MGGIGYPWPFMTHEGDATCARLPREANRYSTGN